MIFSNLEALSHVCDLKYTNNFISHLTIQFYFIFFHILETFIVYFVKLSVEGYQLIII